MTEKERWMFVVLTTIFIAGIGLIANFQTERREKCKLVLNSNLSDAPKTLLAGDVCR